MTAASRRVQRGLSLLEFTLCTVIVALLIAFALERIAGMRLYMERAAVDYTVARMREALAVRFAELVVANQAERIPGHSYGNPLEAGWFESLDVDLRRLPPASEREPGQWYFDAAIGNVVYLPRYPEALQWPDGQPRLLRWRVRADWIDVDGDGEFDRGTDQVRGLGLVRLDGARWQVGGSGAPD